MDNKQESIRRQCQRLWIKALESGESVVLQFPDKVSGERARFAFYEALRKTNDPRLAEAREKIEVSFSRKLFTITLRHRVDNPIFQAMEKVLEAGLAEEQAVEEESEESRLQASLARFRSLKDSPDLAPTRPRNPYFNREE